MAITQLRGTAILPEGISRSDLNVSTAGQAVVRKIIAGTNVTLNSTGVDAGTGDVTINASAGTGSPTGASGTIQYNNAGVFGGAADVFIDSGDLVLKNSTFTVPAAGGVKLIGEDEIGLTNLKLINSFGENKRIIAEGRTFCRFQAMSGSAILTGHQGLLFTATGTSTAITSANTNRYTRINRVEALVTVAATTAVAGFRANSAVCFTGSGTVDGGYWMSIIGGPATGVATATTRFYMGAGNSTAAPTDVEPSSVTNIIGMGFDAADTNIQIMTRGAGAVVKTDTGIVVPAVDRASMYEIIVYQPPGATQAAYIVLYDLINGTIFTKQETTAANLPVANSVMIPKIWSSVGGTSSVIGIALASSKIISNF